MMNPVLILVIGIVLFLLMGIDGGEGAAGAAGEGAGGAGGAAPDWTSGIPEEIRTDPSFANIQDLPGLAKSYVNAQKLIGREKIPMPKADNPEEMRATLARLGLPEDGTKYELPVGEGADPGTVEWFRKTAHEAGLLPGQAKAIYEKWDARVNEIVGAQQTAAAAAEQEASGNLQREWGAAYDGKVQKAVKAFNLFATAEMKAQVADPTKLHPDLLRMFANVAEKVGEDAAVGEGGSMLLTPDQAKIRINQIQADSKHAYFDKKSPAHKDAVAEMERLHKLAWPEEKV